MVLSYNFLKSVFQFENLSPDDIYDLFTKHSIEIEKFYKASNLEGIVTGKIISSVKHPNSDKLTINNVDYGDGIKQILCGANNVYEGMVTAVAPIGTKFSEDFIIAERKMANELSQGMLCAYDEIVDFKVDSEKYSQGIMDFGTSTPIGIEVNKLLKLDDYIFELGITPNRTDLLNLIGQVLEAKAVLKLNPLNFEIDLDYNEDANAQTTPFNIILNDKDASLSEYFSLTQIKLNDFELDYFQEYMLMINSIKLVNPIVDFGNYAMLLCGQPVHFYDADKLSSKNIEIKLSQKEQQFVGLDKKLYSLQGNDIVICNDNKVMALAGVMGSQEFCIDDNTTNVLLEIGRFDSSLVRKTAKKYGLSTDSSYRYERGINYEATFDVSYYIKKEMQKQNNEVFKSNFITNLEIEEKVISFDINDLNISAGHTFSVEQVVKILELLSFDTRVEGENIFVTISLRHNFFEIKEDLYEEILRIFGYDNIEGYIPNDLSLVKLNKFETTKRLVSQFLIDNGFNNVVTYSLVSEKLNQGLSHIPYNQSPVNLMLPLSKDRELLRNNLTSSIEQIASYNLKRDAKNIKMFEIGEIFDQSFSNNEKIMLNATVQGDLFKSFTNQSTKLDFFYLKGLMFNLFTKLNIDTSKITFKASGFDDKMHPYRSASVYFEETYIGYIGNVINKKIKDLYTFELDFEFLVENSNDAITLVKTSQFPTTTRDFSILVSKDTYYDEIEKLIKSVKSEIIKNVYLKNEYQDEKLGNDKSLLVSVELNSVEQNLTEKIINATCDKITKKLEKQFKIQ